MILLAKSDFLKACSAVMFHSLQIYLTVHGSSHANTINPFFETAGKIG
jgi:hypothetical protein